jgi:hypothetical protein
MEAEVLEGTISSKATPQKKRDFRLSFLFQLCYSYNNGFNNGLIDPGSPGGDIITNEISLSICIVSTFGAS